MGATLLDFADLLPLPGIVQPGGPSSIPFEVVPEGAVLPQARDQARRYGLDLATPQPRPQSLAGVWDDAAPPPLRARAWAGGAGAVLATPAASWADVAAGQVYLDVVPADLAGLESQPYPLRVEVQTAAGWIVGWSGTLVPGDAPGGGAAAPRVYCAYGDLVGLAGETLDNLRAASEGAGLLRSRVEAREWVDGLILARYRPAGFASCGQFSPYLGVTTAIDFENPTLRGYLDAGFLMVTPRVRRLAAARALGFALGRQIGNAEYRGLSRYFHAVADNEALQTFGVDLNGDGYPDFTVNCAVLNGRSI